MLRVKYMAISFLTLAEFRACFTNHMDGLANIPDAVHVNRMVAQESSQNDSGDVCLSWLNQHKSTHESCRIERAIASGHQVLNANRIGIRLTHAASRRARQVLLYGVHGTVCVLKMANLVSDHKSELSYVAPKKFNNGRRENNRMGFPDRVRIELCGVSDYDLKSWHRIRLHSALGRILSKARGYIACDFLKLFKTGILRLCANCNANKQTQRENGFHGGQNFIPVLVGSQEAL